MKLSNNLFLILIFILLMMSCNESEDFIKSRDDDAERITNSAQKSSQNPCFSPDGQKVLFTRFLDGYNAGPSELVIVDIDGMNEQIVVPATNSGNVCVPYGSWSGNKICFTSDRAGMADEIWTVNDDGSKLKQVTTHSEEEGVYYIEAGFNPVDTNQIVFEYVISENDETAIHQIAFLDVPTGEITPLTDGSFDDRLPSWSNDGTKILFQRNSYGQDEGWRLYVAEIDVSGPASISNIELIFFGESEYTDCSWGFDDSYILSSSPFDNIEVPNVWMFPLDESLIPTRKSFSQYHEDGAPSQSHDGKTIAFESHLGDSEEEPSEIWIIKE